MALPAFGCADGIDAVTVEAKVERVTLMNALDEQGALKNAAVTIGQKERTYEDIALPADTDATNNTLGKILSSVSYTAEEEIEGPVFHSVTDFTGSSGDTAVDTTADQLCYARLIKWRRKIEKLTVRGYGELPTNFGIDKQGKEVSGVGTGITIRSHSEASDSLIPIVIADCDGTGGRRMVCDTSRYTKNSEQWKEWEFSITVTTPVAAPCETSPLLASMLLFGVAGSDIAALSAFYKCSRTIELNSTGFGKLTESVDIWSDINSKTDTMIGSITD